MSRITSRERAIESQERTIIRARERVQNMRNLPGMQSGRDKLIRDAEDSLRRAKNRLEYLRHPPEPKSRVEEIQDTIAKIDNSIYSRRQDMQKRRAELQTELDALTA